MSNNNTPGITVEEGERPVLLVTTKDGLFVYAGDPTTLKKKLLAQYAVEGYQIQTITITEYREKVKTAKWVFETT